MEVFRLQHAQQAMVNLRAQEAMGGAIEWVYVIPGRVWRRVLTFTEDGLVNAFVTCSFRTGCEYGLMWQQWRWEVRWRERHFRRLAHHHFVRIQTTMRETTRVLANGGVPDIDSLSDDDDDMSDD